MWHKLIRASFGSRKQDFWTRGGTTPISATSGGGKTHWSLNLALHDLSSFTFSKPFKTVFGNDADTQQLKSCRKSAWDPGNDPREWELSTTMTDLVSWRAQGWGSACFQCGMLITTSTWAPLFSIHSPKQASSLLYKKPGSHGGDASAWQLKHMDLTTCARDSWDEQPKEESCAWLPPCIRWPLWVHTQGCLATDTAWSANRIAVMQSYRGLETNSLLQPTNLLTPHKICSYFSMILGNTLKTGSLFW